MARFSSLIESLESLLEANVGASATNVDEYYAAVGKKIKAVLASNGLKGSHPFKSVRITANGWEITTIRPETITALQDGLKDIADGEGKVVKLEKPATYMAGRFVENSEYTYKIKPKGFDEFWEKLNTPGALKKKVVSPASKAVTKLKAAKKADNWQSYQRQVIAGMEELIDKSAKHVSIVHHQQGWNFTSEKVADIDTMQAAFEKVGGVVKRVPGKTENVKEILLFKPEGFTELIAKFYKKQEADKAESAAKDAARRADWKERYGDTDK